LIERWSVSALESVFGRSIGRVSLSGVWFVFVVPIDSVSVVEMDKDHTIEFPDLIY
jgi:hypothetical protein